MKNEAEIEGMQQVFWVQLVFETPGSYRYKLEGERASVRGLPSALYTRENPNSADVLVDFAWERRYRRVPGGNKNVGNAGG